MSILRLPYEIIAPITGYAGMYSTLNLGLTCRRLSQVIYRDQHIGRTAPNMARYSSEALEANVTGNFSRGFPRLAKRRMAVRSAEPWTVAIITMAERFIYIGGYLCYTIEKHLCILNVHQTRTTELVVNTLRLMQHAVRGFDKSPTHTFLPLYCAEGILTCLATQVDRDTTSRLLIFSEAKNNFKWVVTKVISSEISWEHQILIRINKERLFCITKSPAGFEGSMRWNLKRLDLRTCQWSDDKITLWGIDGTKAGEGICFEIINHCLYCVPLERRHQTDYELRDRFYQAVRFPVDEATPGSLEKPSKRHLWRLHDSEGNIDE